MTMADDKANAAGNGGGGNRHSMSSRSGRSRFDRDDDDDDNNVDERIFTSYDDVAAAAAEKQSQGTRSSSASMSSSSPSSSSAGLSSSVERLDLLDDVPMEGKRVMGTFDYKPKKKFGFPSTNKGYKDDVEETVVFHEDPPPPPPPSSASPRRASQEYYDVLEMATSRLREGSAFFEIGDEDSSGDEAVRKKKKKRKSKSKKKGRRSSMSKSKSKSKSFSDDEPEDVEGRRRSAVFQSFLPNSMIERGRKEKFKSTFSAKDLIGGKGGSKNNSDNNNNEDDMMDPNDDLPTRWNPASLVTAAQSKLPGGKTDSRGYYKNDRRALDSAYDRVSNRVTAMLSPQNSPNKEQQMSSDFNLQSIGKSLSDSTGKKQQSSSSHRKKLKKHDSIVWGDESVLSLPGGSVISLPTLKKKKKVPSSQEQAELESFGIEGRAEDPDPTFDELQEANRNYLLRQQELEGRMWKRDRRKLLLCMFVMVILFSVCLGLFLGRKKKQPSGPPTKSYDDDEMTRNEAPARPMPSAPMEPAEGFDSSTSLHEITLQDLHYIVNDLTPDATVLNNLETPQGRAYAWAKKDMEVYRVEVASRVAQRYALATLYYATDGEGWTNNENWLGSETSGSHECDWYGVGCEAGGNNIVSVTYVDLNSNSLVGPLPPEFGRIETLEQLHLWGNSLRGSIPSSFSLLKNLHTMYLDNNELDGEMGDTFDKMHNLKHLDLSGNRLRGHIPHGLGGLIELRDLRLSNNFLSSTFPISLISLSNLQTLLLDSNSISGTLPSLVGEMRSLVTLRVHENDLKGKLPSFVDAERLEEAHLDGNYFSGPIPKFSSRLREIYLGQNALTGSIPPDIGNLAKLEIFNAKSNQLNSTIPVSISNVTELQILDLSHNKLTGTIPKELSNLVRLHEIHLSHNRLKGFAGQFGSMKHLEILHLNNNILEGNLDPGNMLDMGDLDDLKEFAIENNDLSGVIGEYMCDLLLDVLTADCWGTPPRVDCPCCTECF